MPAPTSFCLVALCWFIRSALLWMCNDVGLSMALSKVCKCNSGIIKLIGPGVSAPQSESQWILLHLLLCLAAEGMGGGGKLIFCQLVLAVNEASVVTVGQGKLHEPWEEGPELACSDHSWCLLRAPAVDLDSLLACVCDSSQSQLNKISSFLRGTQPLPCCAGTCG